MFQTPFLPINQLLCVSLTRNLKVEQGRKSKAYAVLIYLDERDKLEGGELD